MTEMQAVADDIKSKYHPSYRAMIDSYRRVGVDAIKRNLANGWMIADVKFIEHVAGQMTLMAIEVCIDKGPDSYVEKGGFAFDYREVEGITEKRWDEMMTVRAIACLGEHKREDAL